jgi:hypothetical protein
MASKPLRIPLHEAAAPAEAVRRYDVHIGLSKDEYERLVAFASRDHRAVANLAKHVLLQWLTQEAGSP